MVVAGSIPVIHPLCKETCPRQVSCFPQTIAIEVSGNLSRYLVRDATPAECRKLLGPAIETDKCYLNCSLPRVGVSSHKFSQSCTVPSGRIAPSSH